MYAVGRFRAGSPTFFIEPNLGDDLTPAKYPLGSESRALRGLGQHQMGNVAGEVPLLAAEYEFLGAVDGVGAVAAWAQPWSNHAEIGSRNEAPGQVHRARPIRPRDHSMGT